MIVGIVGQSGLWRVPFMAPGIAAVMCVYHAFNKGDIMALHPEYTLAGTPIMVFGWN